jgi:excisionase family DNA binding protein
MAEPLPVREAADALGVGNSTLRRWIASGAPVARMGRRGRGTPTLIDLDAMRAWRRQNGVGDALRAFAGRIPELVAAAIYEAHRHCGGPHKRAVIAELPGVWDSVTAALLEALREQIPDLPECRVVPVKIAILRAIKR